MRHEEEVRSAVFSPDGAWVVTGSGNVGGPGTARLWDAASGAALGAPMRHERAVQSAAFSPDGTRVVTASERGAASVPNCARGIRR